MAARKRKILHDDETRSKIQAAMIINRLQNHVAGKIDLAPTQVSSAKLLLDKVLPNLQNVDTTIEANVTGNIVFKTVYERASD